MYSTLNDRKCKSIKNWSANKQEQILLKMTINQKLRTKKRNNMFP